MKEKKNGSESLLSRVLLEISGKPYNKAERMC